MKPTVIGSHDNNEKNTVKPTVIPTQAAPIALPTVPQRKPTVMPAGEPTKTNDQESLTNHVEIAPVHVMRHRPTLIIGGVERKRISVTIDDLRKLNGGTRQNLLEKALDFIYATNVDEVTDRITVLWQSNLQQEYSDLISQCLNLSQSPLLSKVNSYICRMMEILGLIDLKRICGFEQANHSIFDIFTSEGKKIDTLGKLTDAQTELGQLIARMRLKLEELLDLKENLHVLSNKIDHVGDNVEAASIAASFLSDYVLNHKQDANLAQRFSDRSLSLTQTLAQIRSGSSARVIQVEQPLQLIESVQHVTNVMMPGWLGSIVSLKTMLEQKRKPTFTEVNDLGDQMNQIIEKLKEKR